MSGNKEKKIRAPRVGRLDRVGDIISEMGRVYRAARRGEIKPSDATKLTYCLTAIRQSIESSDLEYRIAELEDILESTRLH